MAASPGRVAIATHTTSIVRANQRLGKGNRGAGATRSWGASEEPRMSHFLRFRALPPGCDRALENFDDVLLTHKVIKGR